MYKLKLIEKLRYLKILPGLLIVVSLLTLISNLVSYEAATNLLVALGTVCLFSGVIIYLEYSSVTPDGVRSCIASLWWGLVVGCYTFALHTYRWWEVQDDRDKLVDMLLVTSTLVRCCCDLLDRCASNIIYKSCLVRRGELSMICGFMSVGLFYVNDRSDTALLVICVASTFLIGNLRMKCTMAFPYMLLYAAVCGIAVYDNMSHPMNKPALLCYHLQLVFPSVCDFYLSPMSAIERWNCTFWLSWCKQMIVILMVLVCEITFCLAAYYVVFIHPEFELLIMVPVLTFVFIIWLCAHLGFISSEISLAGKLSECQDFYRKLPTTNGSTDIAHIMSKKGVRQLCMIGQQVVSCTLLSTCLFGGLSWRRQDVIYPSLVLFIVGVECLSFGRHRELAVKLGGTCVAYAIIAPTTVANPKSVVTLLPVDSIKKQNDRATGIISSLNRFFAAYLIEVLGCEYSTSGSGCGVVDEKIRSLFSRRQLDGSTYDTYMLYYSGLTLADGSFVLAGGGNISPDQVIRTWQETNGSSSEAPSNGSRLLIVLDVGDGGAWLRHVTSLRRDRVAVQTCKLTTASSSHHHQHHHHHHHQQRNADVEQQHQQQAYQIGDFTSLWCEWNVEASEKQQIIHPLVGVRESSSSTPSSQQQGGKLRAVYAVSRRWCEVGSSCDVTGSSVTSSLWCRACLMTSSTCSRRLDLIRLLDTPGRRYRRLKMRWFPPKVLDTGHGFKLLRM